MSLSDVLSTYDGQRLKTFIGDVGLFTSREDLVLAFEQADKLIPLLFSKEYTIEQHTIQRNSLTLLGLSFSYARSKLQRLNHELYKYYIEHNKKTNTWAQKNIFKKAYNLLMEDFMNARGIGGTHHNDMNEYLKIARYYRHLEINQNKVLSFMRAGLQQLDAQQQLSTFPTIYLFERMTDEITMRKYLSTRLASYESFYTFENSVSHQGPLGKLHDVITPHEFHDTLLVVQR